MSATGLLVLVSPAFFAAGGPEGSYGPEWRAGDSARYERTASARLDCGNTRRTAKDAMRRFLTILRSGDRARILSVLARDGRFEWIWVFRGNSEPIIDVRDGRRKAARQIAKRGGLPLWIKRFTNSEKPARTTDFGFLVQGKTERNGVGKAALDCRS